MKRILAISGSRADYGLLEWPVKVLRESFDVSFVQMEPPLSSAGAAFQSNHLIEFHKPDCLLILGDRWEILQAAIAAHLQRVPIAHIGGGDVTQGSYDDAMRDCISRMATWHFVTSYESEQNLYDNIGTVNCNNVHWISNIAIDYIKHADWKRPPNHAWPYVVLNYQAETIDGTNEIPAILASLPSDHFVHIILPNADAGSDEIIEQIKAYKATRDKIELHNNLSHDQFLNLIYYCEEFIGNSSSMLYEAPELGVKCRMIGKRQQGRVVPTGDGKASERIKEVLCRCL
jgi:UDP-hydrolysing UDP-N-acetyl-D-glucosamine 2-epimerase